MEKKNFRVKGLHRYYYYPLTFVDTSSIGIVQVLWILGAIGTGALHKDFVQTLSISDAG